jgi:hypothetical protein
MGQEFDGYHCAVCRDEAYKKRARQTAERHREEAQDSEQLQRRYNEMLARQRAREEQHIDAWQAKQAREDAA